MASTPSFQVEDQIDEDFFDKLDDDDFSVEKSPPGSKDMVRELSNLSLGDVGTSMEDAIDAGFVSESTDQQQDGTLYIEKSLPCDISTNQVVQPELFSADTGKVVSDVAVASKNGGGSKVPCVKEVQWSAFSFSSQQLDNGGFGSYQDFFSETTDAVVNEPKPNVDTTFGFIDKPAENYTAENLSTQVSSTEVEDTIFYGSTSEQNADVNDPQYWENLYPGWKYDASTGQWYQVDCYDANMSCQFDSQTISNLEGHESFEDKSQAAAGSNSESSGVIFLQQSSQSMLETIEEDSTLTNISNWNLASQQSIGYPPNMVFDPQYPGWYYDTNTQQWHTIESYTQTSQMTSNAVQDQVLLEGNNSTGFAEENHSSYDGVSVTEQGSTQDDGSHGVGGDWSITTRNYSQQNTLGPSHRNEQQLEGFYGNQHMGSFYSSTTVGGSTTEWQVGQKTFEPVTNHKFGSNTGDGSSHNFTPGESLYRFNQMKVDKSLPSKFSHSYYGNQSMSEFSQQSFQGADTSYSHFPYAPHKGRSSVGRPAHALVAFGFGGKLMVMKDTSSFGANMVSGSQGTGVAAITIVSFSEVFNDNSNIVSGSAFDYFHALCQQSFPGPLVGGNAAMKDVNKWIDERISSFESLGMDFQRGKLLRLLLSLLKISCQHYGKLRSPFGSDPSIEGNDGPEMEVTSLFASAKKSCSSFGEYSPVIHCMQNLPSEGQIRATAIEVQNLLVSGRRKEALQCAQDGQLWGPALVLAAQLGDKFYVDTVKKMAHCQFISGSPLRTLCLLIAGQPADVFSAYSSITSANVVVLASQQAAEVKGSGMLDGWEENLAIITANRTKDDELVMIHLGDCLWKERGEVIAAHTCYLVAEANFESYSDSARLCLIGADHWKYPRTYASPDAIQRTELYEYSKVLGNSQFILQPFQPYKIIYAYMLAEVGKVSDSLRYCQASLKLLKNSGRAPEVETWKSLLSSLEERLRTHQQGGYGTNLDPAKLVGKLFTSIDRSIHRIMGAPPPPLPPLPPRTVDDKQFYSTAPKVANSQSIATSYLVPSASVETISAWTGDSDWKSMHNRSISEPDFGRTPKQDTSSDGSSKDSMTGGSRFGRFGTQLLQKTIGWVSRSHRQAKLGESNKFYYNEKLKRWVEEGAEVPADEPVLAPPPKAASFQNGTPDYSLNNAFKSESLMEGPETKPPAPSEHNSGIPPIPPSQNQFSARNRMGVRSRYVDTFNKGGGASANSFQSPAVPSVKPLVGTKFFVPSVPATLDETRAVTAEDNNQEATYHEEPSTSVPRDASFSSPSSSSASSMPRFPSMDSITPGNKGSGASSWSSNGPLSRTRAASWSGSYTEAFNPAMAEIKPLSNEHRQASMSASFMPNHTVAHSSSSSSLQLNGGSLDDLHEVEL